MGIIRFILIDVLPLLIDLLLPTFLIGYGIMVRDFIVVVCGLLYMYVTLIMLFCTE